MDESLMDDRQYKWDVRFLQLAEHIAGWSRDPSTKVGSILIRNTNEIVGLGYNGFPRGVQDTEERYINRDLKYKLVCHSELNSILMAGERAKGSTLYVWPSFMLPPVCNECCKVAIQAGVSEIVGWLVDEDKLDDRQLRWKESILLSRQMCDEAGVSYRGIPLITSPSATYTYTIGAGGGR
jgi:dCMP deaminase